MTNPKKSWGVGVGLRTQHYPEILGQWPSMDWFEAISENYMDSGGRPFHTLEQIRHHYPIALHGTSMSLGSTDPFHPDYLPRLKKLVDRIDPFIVSDHLCWSGVENNHLYDLLPLPFTQEAIRHLVSRIQHVQDFLGRKILIENVSTYVTFRNSEMPEWEFISEISKQSGCGILLDLNNIYVNSVNHQFNPVEYIQNIPAESVGQFHLAGHTDMGKFLFDTHNGVVIDRVWDLYREALKRFGHVSTLIEWDADIPSFERLSEEAAKARSIYNHFNFTGTEKPSQVDVRAKSNASPQGPSLSEIQKGIRFRVQPQRRQFDPAGKILNPQAGDPGEARLDVYADGYTARFKESLAEVFETIHAVLGEQLFCDAAYEYAQKFPSNHYNLNLVGHHFSDFIKEQPALNEWPYLADLAKLEWQIAEAFHAYDSEPMNLSQVSSISADEWEGLRIIFQPSVSVVASEWPILDIWLKRKEPGAVAGIGLEKRAQNILVGRRELMVRCELMDANQLLLIRGLLGGETLGEVCETLADLIDEEAELPISTWFQQWVSDKLIARCESANQTSL